VSGLLPSRGEIWLVDLDPVRGREQAGKRPALVVSTDIFNHGPAELVLLVPITTKDKRIPLHVPIAPAESGLREPSFVKCEDLRSVSRDRLTRRLGAVRPDTLAEVEDRLRILLEL
jgi:mRNA interferase MazF